jgi:hypothetical protein
MRYRAHQPQCHDNEGWERRHPISPTMRDHVTSRDLCPRSATLLLEMLPASPAQGGRTMARFHPEPFLVFFVDIREDGPRTAIFHLGRELDPMLLEVVKAALPEVGTPPHLLAGALPDIASLTYVLISSDWVLPVETNDHVSSAALWIESDVCEAVGDKDDGPAPGQATSPVEALSSQVQALDQALEADQDSGHGGPAQIAALGDVTYSHQFLNELFAHVAILTLKAPASQ